MTKVLLFRWQKSKNPGDWRRGDLEEEVECADINDDDVHYDGNLKIDCFENFNVIGLLLIFTSQETTVCQ